MGLDTHELNKQEDRTAAEPEPKPDSSIMWPSKKTVRESQEDKKPEGITWISQ